LYNQGAINDLFNFSLAILVRKDIDVAEHEGLSNFYLDTN